MYHRNGTSVKKKGGTNLHMDGEVEHKIGDLGHAKRCLGGQRPADPAKRRLKRKQKRGVLALYKEGRPPGALHFKKEWMP